MRICACLCWFDERPKMLRQCVRSLAGVADCLAALDGPFGCYPNAARRRTSSKQQYDAIRKTAADVGLPAKITGMGPWETQPVKRSHLVGLAVSYFGLRADRDWLLIVDADEYVDVLRPTWRSKLERTPPQKLVALVEGENWSRMPRLIRALPTLAYEDAHNRLVSNGRVLIHGAPQVPVVDLFGLLRVSHDRNGRLRERNINANLYRLARRETGER